MHNLNLQTPQIKIRKYEKYKLQIENMQKLNS